MKDLVTGEEYKEAYDTLVLSPGAVPIMPKSIKGIDKKHVFSVRNVVDIVNIDNYTMLKMLLLSVVALLVLK